MLEFFVITLIITLAAISPGPDFVMVTKNALLYSRAGGIFTSLGVSCSLLFHVTYCIMGLSIIIAQSLLLFNVIKYLGALYLIYIGIKGLLAKEQGLPTENPISNPDKSISNLRAFQQGFLSNALNPKAIMFLLSLFTLAVKPSTPFVVQIIYAIEIVVIHFLWFSGLSIMLTHHKISPSLKKIQLILTKVMGGVLVIFGIRIATLAHHL